MGSALLRLRSELEALELQARQVETLSSVQSAKQRAALKRIRVRIAALRRELGVEVQP